MPRYNVWIKQEQQLLWDAIPNKSAWIAQHLAEPPVAMKSIQGEVGAARKAADLPMPNCKVHGTPLTVWGKCLQKGCKHA